MAGWLEEVAHLPTANALGDAFRAAGADAEADFATQMAAHALCVFNISGVGELARKRGKDVQVEAIWFLDMFMRTIGEEIERRYPQS